MKSERSLTRLLYLVESVNLACLTLCLSCLLLFLFPEGTKTQVLLWTLGTVIPVQLIRLLGDRLQKPLHIWLACVGILALSVLIPNTGMRRFTYGACCIPMILAVTLLGRPGGKLVLTVPKLYHPGAALVVFAFGKISVSDWLCTIGITLGILLILCFLIYQNQQHLLKALRENVGATVSFERVVTLNRQLMALFFCIGVIAAVVTLGMLRTREIRKPPEEPETEYVDFVPMTQAAEDMEGKNPITPKQKSPPVDLRFLIAGRDLFGFTLGVFGVLVFVVCVVLVLRNIGDDRPKHNPLQKRTYALEKLVPLKKNPRETDPSDIGYARKIRKRYSKLILRGAKQPALLAPLSPAELEAEAGLPTNRAAASLHQLYEKARYSSQPVSREDYQQAKAAAEVLNQRLNVRNPESGNPSNSPSR